MHANAEVLNIRAMRGRIVFNGSITLSIFAFRVNLRAFSDVVSLSSANFADGLNLARPR
jgi:hypothetical protein